MKYDGIGRHAALFNEYAELRVQENTTLRISLLNGDVVGNSRGAQAGVSARAFKDGVWGFSSSPEKADGSIRATVERAVGNARFLASKRASSDVLVKGPLPSRPGHANMNLATVKPRLDQKSLIEFIRAIDAYCAKYYPGLSSRSISLSCLDMEKTLVTADGELASAGRGQAITLTLADEVDVSRGDVIAAAALPPQVADQFAAHLLWMGDAPLLPGRPYWLKIGARTLAAQVTEIKHKVDVNTQARLAAKSLELNEVAYCNLSLDQPIPFEAYAENRTLGGFILIDRQSNATVGAGTLDFALRRAANIHWQHLEVDQAARAGIKGQQPRCLWFTGLSGAGKSTVANLVEKQLLAKGYHTYLLDGDNVRHGLNKDLGFTDEDRVENIRRVAEVARLMTDAGLIVLVSFISPFRAERRMARELFPDGEFIEVFVDTPLAVAEQRDVKGLYAKARAGQIRNFTGIDSPYEAPEHAEIHLRTVQATPAGMADAVVRYLLGGEG